MSRREYHTEIKHENGKLYAHTTFDDSLSLEQNNRIRKANLFDKPKMALHENEDMRFIISCPDIFQWNIWKRDNKSDYKDLISKDEHTRMKGARSLAFTHPEWVLYSRS